MRNLLSRSITLTLMAIVCVVIGAAHQVAATSGSEWSAGAPMDVSFEWYGNVIPRLSDFCSREKVLVGLAFTKTDMCIVRNDSWRYGWMGTSDGNVGESLHKQNLAVGFGRDSRLYRLLYTHGIILTPTHTAIIPGPARPGMSYWTLSVVSNFPSKLTKSFDHLGPYYTFSGTPDYTFKWQIGGFLDVRAVGSSINNKWLAVELHERGIVLINLETFEARRISSAYVTRTYNSNPYMQFAVSNDGRYVVALGGGVEGRVITVDNNCGDLLYREVEKGEPIENPCAEFSLESLSVSLVHIKSGWYPAFNDDATELRFSSGTGKWTILRTPRYGSPRQVDYLALGDSFSSGEGDTAKNPATKKKYYLPFTDVEGVSTIPKEKCHISSRSYPFALAGLVGTPSDRVKSIACSGAVVSKDYAQSSENYNGQDERLSVLGSDGLKEQYKKDALNTFIPGRNQQIEFVRKYKPKAITLTAGGNDAGFGDIIRACVVPDKKTLGGSIACRYAETIEGRASLGKAINGQYDSLARLYSELHAASPATKIYALGYPQFFSEGNTRLCAPNVRFSKEERIMARAAVTYMNNVIRAAAETAGVKYISVENSLGNNVLCGGQESYVTGLAGTGNFTSGVSEMFSSESFHPNAKGHQKMAEAVQKALGNKRLDEYEYCGEPGATTCTYGEVAEPEIPEFFAEAMGIDTTNYIHSSVTEKNIFQKGKDTIVNRIKGLRRNTTVTIKLFSDPINLGEYVTDATGNLNTSISIPEYIPAGPHTLQIEASTFSGEPITLWGIIWVIGREGDTDEDGIPDTQQACLFVSDSGLDSDNDGVDDACDPELVSITSGVENPGAPRVFTEPVSGAKTLDSNTTGTLLSGASLNGSPPRSVGDKESPVPPRLLSPLAKQTASDDHNSGLLILLGFVVLGLILTLMKRIAGSFIVRR